MRDMRDLDSEQILFRIFATIGALLSIYCSTGGV